MSDNFLSSQQVIHVDSDIIALVNKIIEHAIEESASDIHIEPERNRLIIRIRVDGILRVAFETPKEVTQALVARFKIMAELDMTGLPRPQEGSIKFSSRKGDVDLRVSVFPTSYGECIVMRILENVNIYKGFEDLGFSMEQTELLDKIISMPFGLILVTGPTGSGKSTTLFTMLNKLNDPGKSLVTLEDPIERRLDHVRQTQINPEVNLTFASGLHYQLRQDSDVIMVGEIRDSETANIAVQAAITGHLVLATIHTNSSVGAITRLINMGVEPFLISSALKIVTAQRLARINCPHCREEFVPLPETLSRIKVEEGTKLFKSKGCDKCQGKGVIGRFGIHEVLNVTHEIKNAICANLDEDKLLEMAKRDGMVTLREIAIMRAQEGVLSAEEVMRLTE